MGVQAAARRVLTLESRGPAVLAPARSPGFRAPSWSHPRRAGCWGRRGGDTNPGGRVLAASS